MYPVMLIMFDIKRIIGGNTLPYSTRSNVADVTGSCNDVCIVYL